MGPGHLLEGLQLDVEGDGAPGQPLHQAAPLEERLRRRAACRVHRLGLTMLWALLVLPAAMLVFPRLVRSRREQIGPGPAPAVPMAHLESASRGRRRGPSDLVISTGPLGKPAPLGRFGLSTLGVVVLALVLLGGALLLVARDW